MGAANDTAILDALGVVLAYPRDETATCVRRAREAMAGAAPDVAKGLASLDSTLASESIAEVEELFTRTFDVNPLCSLEVGWHLFGEDYARGAFLVRMRETLRALEIPETTELPDHLSHVLAAMGRLGDDAARVLACEFVGPALVQMLEKFPASDNPYRAALETVLAWLRHRYGEPVPLPQAASSFGGSPYASACGGCSVAAPTGD